MADCRPEIQGLTLGSPIRRALIRCRSSHPCMAPYGISTGNHRSAHHQRQRDGARARASRRTTIRSKSCGKPNPRKITSRPSGLKTQARPYKRGSLPEPTMFSRIATSSIFSETPLQIGPPRKELHDLRQTGPCTTTGCPPQSSEQERRVDSTGPSGSTA